MHTTDTYYKAMEVLTAQDRLYGLTVADWPNMKKGPRSKLHRQLHRIAFPTTHANPVSPVDLAKMLGASKL